ncbi:MAG: glycosyltransferase family 2 protein, partial [bacterium]
MRPHARVTQPLVSVVLPLHNGERFLGEALRSVLWQSLRELELIVVDDGSTDGGRALAEAEAARDARVQVLAGPGQGISAACNLGLARATGTYIARMDQDDRCHPRRLEHQADFLRSHPEVGVLGGQKRLFGAAGLRQYDYPARHEDIQAAVFFYCPILGPTSMFRASLVPQNGALYASGEDYAEDYGLLSRWLEAGLKAAVLPELVLDYRVHPGQASQTQAPRLTLAADAIRLRWLNRMGLEPEGKERELHLAAGQGRWGSGLDYLADLERWFLKLRSACAIADFPEPLAFDRVLAQRWHRSMAPPFPEEPRC